MWYLTRIILIIALCCYESSAYQAAVLDYHPLVGDTPDGTIAKNLAEFGDYVKRAKSQKADIIVFPEYGLTTMVEKPEEYAIEIDQQHWVLKNLTSLAKTNVIYIVVNLLEKVPKNETTHYYNTNLVFNRQGEIVKKYQKINLFGEPNLISGSSTQKPTFTTDFNITFAMFTCFDILYRNPSRTALEGNIMDVIYPTSWFSTMPFYMSLSVQHGYAISTGVSLLVSNLNDPKNTHGGSGIYLSDGAEHLFHITDLEKTQMLVKLVPKRRFRKNRHYCRATTPLRTIPPPPESNLSHYQTLRDFNASNYTFKTLDLNQKETNTDICYKNFCCSFYLRVISTSPGDIYKLMAFDGTVPFDRSTAHVRICALLACGNDSNDSCGTRVETKTKFGRIEATGNCQTDSTGFCNPLTLNYDLQPLTETNFCDQTNSQKLITTDHEYSNVLVFGLFERTN